MSNNSSYGAPRRDRGDGGNYGSEESRNNRNMEDRSNGKRFSDRDGGMGDRGFKKPKFDDYDRSFNDNPFRDESRRGISPPRQGGYPKKHTAYENHNNRGNSYHRDSNMRREPSPPRGGPQDRRDYHGGNRNNNNNNNNNRNRSPPRHSSNHRNMSPPRNSNNSMNLNSRQVSPPRGGNNSMNVNSRQVSPPRNRQVSPPRNVNVNSSNNRQVSPPRSIVSNNNNKNRNTSPPRSNTTPMNTTTKDSNSNAIINDIVFGDSDRIVSALSDRKTGLVSASDFELQERARYSDPKVAVSTIEDAAQITHRNADGSISAVSTIPVKKNWNKQEYTDITQSVHGAGQKHLQDQKEQKKRERKSRFQKLGTGMYDMTLDQEQRDKVFEEDPQVGMERLREEEKKMERKEYLERKRRDELDAVSRRRMARLDAAKVVSKEEERRVRAEIQKEVEEEARLDKQRLQDEIRLDTLQVDLRPQRDETTGEQLKDGRRIERPVCTKQPWINRYNIKPGYRWDGVDRGNSWEGKIFEKFAHQKQ